MKKQGVRIVLGDIWVLDGGPIEILRNFIGCKSINDKGC